MCGRSVFCFRSVCFCAGSKEEDLKAYQIHGIIRFNNVRKGARRVKISTKGRYALRMMLDLAEHQKDGYVALKDVAARQGISKKYLEQIVPILNRSDVLQTNRGFQGGYRLARKPKDYTVGEILRLTEGSLAPVACLERSPMECERSAGCATLPVRQGLHKVICEYLDGITLQDILDREQVRQIDDYSI